MPKTNKFNFLKNLKIKFIETKGFTVADFNSLEIVIKLSKIYKSQQITINYNKSQLTTSNLITN